MKSRILSFLRLAIGKASRQVAANLTSISIVCLGIKMLPSDLLMFCAYRFG
jgi:hypothetical protein